MKCVNERHGIKLARFVADQHRVENLVPQARQPDRETDGLFEDHLRSAVDGKSFGQPPAGALVCRDIQHAHARGEATKSHSSSVF